MATVIDGEPIKDYVQRTLGANDDKEVTRLSNRVRKQKERIAFDIKKALNDDKELLWQPPELIGFW
jgi:hypothetical protein